MTFTIYHSQYARSMRILWLCEELGLPYEIERVGIWGRGEVPAGYEKIHPRKKVPGFVDGEVKMFESLAILDYISGRYKDDLTVKPDDGAYPDYLQWLHFGEATLPVPVTMCLANRQLLPEGRRNEPIAKWGEREGREWLKVMAEPLAERDFLSPSGFSLADISCGYTLLLAKFAGIMNEDTPEPVTAYFKRLSGREAWKKASV